MTISLRALVVFALLSSLALIAFVAVRTSVPGGDDAVAAYTGDAAARIEQGAYLATAGNCVSCHTTEAGAPMAGGLAFRTPFGTIYSTNITPDPATGIGAWSERDFLNSMRHGVRPDGEHLYPVFPYTAFTRVSDEDLMAIFAYLRSLPPVQQAAPANELPFPFGFRPLMAFWKAFFFEPGVFEADPERAEDWNRGAYLVEALGHCSACHSPRNPLGAERSNLAYSGGDYVDLLAEDAYGPWSAPNLTATPRGLALWSREDLAAYLGHGRNDFLESFGPMNEVILNSTRHLDAADVDAMAVYLKSLPAIAEARAPTPDASTMGRGRTVYNLHCGTCHLPTGEGDPEMGPRLNAGSLVVQSDDPASMINAILYGPSTPQPSLATAQGATWRHPMEEFQYLLDDDEIAAAASFVRNSWDNSAGLVTPEQVARQRPEAVR